MDLQAILDAPSSPSSSDVPYKYKTYEDGLSDISSAPHDTSFKDSYRCSDSYDSQDFILPAKRGKNLELERILRDGDDDDDEDYSNRARSEWEERDNDLLHSILNENEENSHEEDESCDEYKGQSNHSRKNSLEMPLYSNGQPSTVPMSHSMELDAILDSLDDDDEPTDHALNSSFLTYHQRMLSIRTDSDEEEDYNEDDQDIGLNFNFSKDSILRPTTDNITYENLSTQYKISRRVPSQDDEHYGQQIYLHRRKNSTTLTGEQSLKEYTANFLHRHNTKSSPEKDEASKTASNEPLPTPLSEDQRNEQISEMCLRSAELFEHRLLKPNNRNVISPLTVKRRMKPKVILQSKSRRNNNNHQATPSFTQQPQSQPRFGFSGGIIQVKPMADLTPHIIKSHAQQTQINQRDVTESEFQGGLPTTMAVNSKFIAVGTQRGEIWIFDLFEQLKMTLGAEESATGVGNKKKVHSVTSIDLPIHGDYLLAGYRSGVIILWDVIKGVVLKGMFDLHSSPITSVRLTSFPMGGNDGDIGAVSVDASGLVSKIAYSRGRIWSSYSAETECLLDGTAGQILAIDTLPPLDATEYQEGALDYHPSAYKIVLIALSSDRSSFAVSVMPKVSVLHKWARPTPDKIYPTSVQFQEGVSDMTSAIASTYGSLIGNENLAVKEPEMLPHLPCLSWGWALVSGGNNTVTPILARSWGCCIQFLCANFPPCDELDAKTEDGTIHWPAFGLHDEFDSSSPVVSLNWLGTRSLVYLTLSNEFTIIDTVIMTMQERLDFSGIKLVYAEFALHRPKHPESNLCSTFMNSIRSNDNRLLVLCEDEVKQITVLGITEQVSSLEDGGQWLEALALALDHYESTIQIQEDRQRNTTRGTMPHTDNSFLSKDEIWMAELLMRYLLLAIDNAPEPEMYSTNKRLNLAQSHFEMLSGVCLEYCVTMKRVDLLFGPIFRCFYEARYINVFLDVMETYILNDRLKYIAPEAMVLFVAHCNDMKNISMVERCLLHLDCNLMDFDSILTLLKKNALYTGLLHVYSTCLDDYTSPLDVLFEAIFDAIDSSNCIYSERREEGILDNTLEQYGYKALMYIKYSMSGRSFPKGDIVISEERIQTLRSEVFGLLFRERVVLSQQRSHDTTSKRSHGIRTSVYPYIRALILVDAKATLDCLTIALDDPCAMFDETTKIDTVGSWDVEYGTDSDRNLSGLVQNISSEKDPRMLPDRQHLVNILSSVFMTDDIVTFDNHFGIREPGLVTSNAKNSFLDFLAKYLELGVFTAPHYLTANVMTRLCNKSKNSTSEDQVLSLLKALPRSSYEIDEILNTVERTDLTRSALFLYQSGVSRTIDRPSMSEKCQKYFNSAIDCFLKDQDDEFRKNLFEYARKECSGGGSSATSDCNSSSILKQSLLQRVPDLVRLDAVQTAKLAGELFIGDIDTILSSLKDIDSGRTQYSFLHAIISDLSRVDPVTAQELAVNLTKEHQHSYLSLMARFQPDQVYSYLSSNQNYRLEDALKLCQDRRITDGSAYLLERMGDISGALTLMLQTLDTRMIGLKNIIQESISSAPVPRSQIGKISTLQTRLRNNQAAEKELAGAKQTLSAVLDLCERNKNDHLMLEDERGPLLWFHVLDRLVNAKHLLGASKNTTGYHLAAISTILSELLMMTMQRMTHHVSHNELMHKITVDHAGSDLGEFREMLVSVLKTYSSELDVCINALNVVHHDIRNLSVQRKNLKVRGSFIQFFNKSISRNTVIEVHPSRRFQATSGRHSNHHCSKALQTNTSISLRQRRKSQTQRGMRTDRLLQTKKDKTKILNFMTASERQYSTSESQLNMAYSFDDDGVRQVGALTEAQNRGSLF